MTNSFVGLLNSIFVHLFLFAILTLDFSVFVPQKDRINAIPIEFVTFPTNSPFIKFEILPNKIPIGAEIDTKSKKIKISFLFFFENK